MREKEGREEGAREIVKDKGGDRAITSREEGQRVLGIHTRGIPSGSLRDLFFPLHKCLQNPLAVEKGIEDGTMRAQGSRDIVTPSCFPAPSSPSRRNPGGAPSSLFLAPRACENSCTQAAFRPPPSRKRVVHRANYPRLMTLPPDVKPVYPSNLSIHPRFVIKIPMAISRAWIFVLSIDLSLRFFVQRVFLQPILSSVVDLKREKYFCKRDKLLYRSVYKYLYRSLFHSCKYYLLTYIFKSNRK